MTDVTRFAAACRDFPATVNRYQPALVAALRAAGYGVDSTATVRGLVRLARTLRTTPGLADFEAAVRPHLVALLGDTPKRYWHLLPPDVQFLRDHFDRFTEVPVTANPVKRVLTWARRHYRAWRKADP